MAVLRIGSIQQKGKHDEYDDEMSNIRAKLNIKEGSQWTTKVWLDKKKHFDSFQDKKLNKRGKSTKRRSSAKSRRKNSSSKSSTKLASKSTLKSPKSSSLKRQNKNKNKDKGDVMMMDNNDDLKITKSQTMNNNNNLTLKDEENSDLNIVISKLREFIQKWQNVEQKYDQRKGNSVIPHQEAQDIYHHRTVFYKLLNRLKKKRKNAWKQFLTQSKLTWSNNDDDDGDKLWVLIQKMQIFETGDCWKNGIMVQRNHNEINTADELMIAVIQHNVPIATKNDEYSSSAPTTNAEHETDANFAPTTSISTNSSMNASSSFDSNSDQTESAAINSSNNNQQLLTTHSSSSSSSNNTSLTTECDNKSNDLSQPKRSKRKTSGHRKLRLPKTNLNPKQALNLIKSKKLKVKSNKYHIRKYNDKSKYQWKSQKTTTSTSTNCEHENHNCHCALNNDNNDENNDNDEDIDNEDDDKNVDELSNFLQI